MEELAEIFEEMLKDEHHTLTISRDPNLGLNLAWRRRDDDEVTSLHRTCAAPRYHLIHILSQMLDEIKEHDE